MARADAPVPDPSARRAGPSGALAAALLAAVLLLATAAPATAQTSSAADAPMDRVPAALLADTVELRRALENASAADGADQLRAAHARAADVAPDVLPHLRTLGASDGELMSAYWTSFDEEVAAANGSDDANATNARSLARAAVRTLRDDLEPRVRAWDRVRTAVTPGAASAAGDGRLRVPVLLLNPPPGGLGAFDVELVAPPGTLVPVAAEVAVGQGQARVEADNGSARLAAFDAQALAGLSSGVPSVTLGTVTYRVADAAPAASPGGLDPDPDPSPVVLRVVLHELVDPGADPVPAVAPDGAVSAAAAAGAAGPPAWTALLLVGGLGVAAVWFLRRRLGGW